MDMNRFELRFSLVSIHTHKTLRVMGSYGTERVMVVDGDLELDSQRLI